MTRNRLGKEKSPYLQQHAENPVDWYPWGEEAFRAAKSQDKPIFLSIGYATCHWCHVMERESFQNEEIAKEMNRIFINIKVDREELPAVDALYMELAQAMLSQAAGWPLTMILTPELKPFFAATYLPPEPRRGLASLPEIVSEIEKLWRSPEREQIEERAHALMTLFKEAKVVEESPMPTKEMVADAMELLFRTSDPVNGGAIGSPKFPMGYRESLLILYSLLQKESRALFLAERTLERMALGGIHDAIGGGFSRYAVDGKWMIPHFEKMLYDNALLLDAYTMGFLATGEKLFREVVFATVKYLLRTMQSEEGGFFSAEDSETHGEEGTYYSWSESELITSLGDKGEIFCRYFGVTRKGNFNARSILFAELTPKQFAQKENIPLEKLEEILSSSKEVLYKIRNTSVPPFKDKKIITAWNGLAIHALLAAGVAFDQSLWWKAGLKALQFVKEKLFEEGELKRRYAEGEAKHPATLEDYAFFIRALITAYEGGFGEKWLRDAEELTERLEKDFKSSFGPYYQAKEGDTGLDVRNMHYSDGSEPSGNAVQTENLLRLYRITDNPSYLKRAEEILSASAIHIRTYPPSFLYHIQNILRYSEKEAPTYRFTYSKDEDIETIRKALFSKLEPFRGVSWKKGKECSLTICRWGRCEEPIHGLPAILVTLNT